MESFPVMLNTCPFRFSLNISSQISKMAVWFSPLRTFWWKIVSEYGEIKLQTFAKMKVYYRRRSDMKGQKGAPPETCLFSCVYISIWINSYIFMLPNIKKQMRLEFCYLSFHWFISRMHPMRYNFTQARRRKVLIRLFLGTNFWRRFFYHQELSTVCPMLQTSVFCSLLLWKAKGVKILYA